MWQKIQNYILVSIIAALVWLYAENENVKPRDIDFNVVFVTESPNEIIVSPTAPTRVRVSVRASTAQLAELRRRQQQGPLQISVGYDAQAEAGRQTIVLAQRMAEDAAFRERGIGQLETQPETLAVTVDRIEEIDVPVVVDTIGLAVKGQATVEPAMIKLRVAASVARREGPFTAVAHLSDLSVDWAELEPNIAHALPPARLTLMPDLESGQAQLMPDTATITFTVIRQTDEIILPFVPITVGMPPGTRGYTVELHEDDRVLREVTLRGPTQTIARIREDASTIFALLRLTADDIEKRIDSKTVTIQKPSEVEVVSPILPSVRLTIERIEPRPDNGAVAP